MTKQEAIEVIKLAQAQVEWEYPMDYAVAFDMAISALQAQDIPDTNVGKIDKYGYIGIETLLNFCDNSKYHAVAVTPNDFMRMKRVRMPEPCEDAVSRKDVQSIAERSDWFESSDFMWALYELPSVTPKRKEGEWKWTSGDPRIMTCSRFEAWTCSECGKKFEIRTNYCPNCGAKMSGGEQE